MTATHSPARYDYHHSVKVYDLLIHIQNMCVMKIQTTKKERKQMLTIFLIIGMITSCAIPQQAAQQDLQPTETHDVLVDPATGAQWYVPRQ